MFSPTLLAEGMTALESKLDRLGAANLAFLLTRADLHYFWPQTKLLLELFGSFEPVLHPVAIPLVMSGYDDHFVLWDL